MLDSIKHLNKYCQPKREPCIQAVKVRAPTDLLISSSVKLLLIAGTAQVRITRMGRRKKKNVNSNLILMSYALRTESDEDRRGGGKKKKKKKKKKQKKKWYSPKESTLIKKKERKKGHMQLPTVISVWTAERLLPQLVGS